MTGKRKEVTIQSKLIPFRQEFYKAQKNTNESADEWLHRVKELSKPCCFEYLDIKSSLEYIQTYETQKANFCSGPFLNDELLQNSSKIEAVYPQVMIKVELPSDNSAANSECDSEVIANLNKDDRDNPDSIDSTNSNFLCDKIQQILPEETSDEQFTEELNETDLKNENKIDSNVPKKKRKYKKRATKEKQIFECEICHYKCEHECHLRRHKLTHLNEKSFICDKCGKGFNLFINLNAHIRRHIGFKPHSCDICKSSFLDKTRLKLHMRTHSGERPFGCTICEKRFADRYYLKVHMRLQTGEKPFVCEVCKKGFSQSSSLSTHKKTCVQKSFKRLEFLT